MRASTLLLCGVILASSSSGPASAAATEVSARHDPSADFSSYRTFSWRAGKPATIAKAQAWIVSAVETNLIAAGLAKVDGGADLYVITYSLVDQHTLDELADVNVWQFWTGVQSVRATDIGVGTLVVDLVDTGTEQIVWRGLVAGAVSGNVEKNRAKIDKLVRKVFEKLPGARP